MKHIKNYKSYLTINELFVHKNDDELDGKYFILYKENLWIFSEDEWEEKELWNKINKNTGEDLFDEDLYDSIIKLSEDHAYILTGQIIDSYIVINGSNSYRHSSSSIDLKKLKKEIDLPIKVEYRSGPYLDNEEDFELDIISDYKDAYYYHGTTTEYLREISKTGIRPMDKNSNYDKINHMDKIFFTSNMERALYHANTAAINTKSFPIILKFKVPDIDKVVIDYDLSMDFYGEDTDINNELGYSNIKKNSGSSYIKKNSILKDSEKVNILNKLGIYGYKGRIAPSFIIDVFADIAVMQDYPFMLDSEIASIFGEELTYESEVWNNFTSVQYWAEMSMKELLNRIDEIVDDNLNYGEEDDEN